MKKNICLMICIILSVNLNSFGVVKLPNIFANNMILQRNKPIVVWGYADRNEIVEVSFNQETKRTKADKNGNWKVILSPREAGRDYVLRVKGSKNTIQLKNILIGDLWLCSGQSNMEMPLDGWAKVLDYENEIKNANYSDIRTYNVEKAVSEIPKDDLNGQWLICSPETAANFSATAYFFARKLYQELNIPIGIIHSSWGGTDIEPWISLDSFSKLPVTFKKRYGDIATVDDMNKYYSENESNKVYYEQAINNDQGLIENWYNNTDFKNWKAIAMPNSWDQSEIGDADGIIWFTYELNLPLEAELQQATLHLGAIDDQDITWVNGHQIGDTKGYNTPRIYNIPQDILTKGLNRITVRIFDEMGDGGMYAQPQDIFLQIGDNKYSLAGNWFYKESATNRMFNYKVQSANSLPSLLYNTMVNPLKNIPFKGVIWYQGENNANEAYNYRTLFPTLINDWRAQWSNDHLPFYWVQLANYMVKDEMPVNSPWAELREAQDMTLSLPNTGQAIIIDTGEANDIHPRNKQDVGLRLALIALNKTYMTSNVYSGPRYKSHKIDGNKIIITLDSEDIVIRSKYGYIEGFAIAGDDQKFVWAKAELIDGKIIVYSDKISHPLTVRYAWANNPDISIFNEIGLPLAPFRTNSWR